MKNFWFHIDLSLANDRWVEDVFGQHINTAVGNLPSEIIAIVQERGKLRDIKATVQELLSEIDE